MRLNNKVAIVTGASRGIGKAIAERFASEGASVILAGRSLDLLELCARKIINGGGGAIACIVDVRNPESVQHLVDRTVATHGRLDVIINNAGISMVRESTDLPLDKWAEALETNLYGTFYGCQSAARQMISQGGGSIINITSSYGIVAAPMRAAYCASKAAANMLTKVLASEWGPKNIRVNAIAPGYIKTELVKEIVDQGMLDEEAVKQRTPQRRMGEVDDVSGAAVYLAADESAYVTGSVLTVDGGWTAYGYL